jgi:hypothetical protein
MPASTHTLPCVVHLGFAGSRRLFDNASVEPERQVAWQAAVEDHLKQRLAQLPTELRLGSNHFLVGISQVACGADLHFTRVCRDLQIPQRIFLPQHLQAYLTAVGSNGTPDFTPGERAEVETLMDSAHIIQERVVSHSADRMEQFAETNVEILRISDVIVCLLGENATEKPGGTQQLLERARSRGIAVLEIQIGVTDNQPTFRETWHHVDDQHPFQPPQLPEELADLPLATAEMPPSRDAFCEPLKRLVSSQAAWHQRLFKFAAVVIIVTHTLATICATLAVAFHGIGEDHRAIATEVESAAEGSAGVTEPAPWLFAALLAIEVGFLLTGFVVHRHLHHSRAARIWAVSRVVAELARSLQAIGDRHMYLEYLFRLPLPFHFRPLLRTLNVLHLRSTWVRRHESWEPLRKQYLDQRFDHPANGQVHFYEQRLEQDERRLGLCQWAFTVCSVLAIIATAIKLGLLLNGEWLGTWNEFVMATLGTFAIVLPILAVGGLSWAAALDCEARVETFSETLKFLRRQKPLLEQAESAREFDLLLMETETALLGETSNWFSRRSNTGVN